ncbi:hypothetical protein HYH03_001498 [Edaphochlamys debaryana]|uniref:Uncharacterized protein n=1 Tax=Edaphochlamys debaryana TaxID=47281 RepID=A0A835YN38_9CHLO|nr:hypothetical protein HYH03_001498 [Edaphochlamys debaryana]|eukprot:KAG2500734.1 hypothetical protein HYH03_001498 [Edaphochlamys debaryana]
MQVDCGEGAAQLWAGKLEGQATGVVLALSSSQQGGGAGNLEAGARPASKGALTPASSPYLLRASHPEPLSAARELFNQLGVMADVLYVCTPPFRAPSGKADASPYVHHLGPWLDLLAPEGVFLVPDDPDRVVALALTELGLSSWPAAEAAPQKLRPSLPSEGSGGTLGHVSVSFPGNLIGPYVQCLSLAQLLGYTFQYATSFDDHWLRHLPRLVEPGLVRANPPEVKRALDVCAHKYWAYPHECLYGWRAAKPAVEHVIRQAFFRWLKKTGNQLQAFEPTDALIQLRCAKDTLLDHWNYGPAAFSYYIDNLPPGTRREFALYARHGHLSPRHYEPCERIVEALGAHITAHRPGVEFSIVGGALWEDFGRLLTAPTVFAEGSSSLGLWATLANLNTAFHPPFLAPLDGAEFGALFKPRIHPRYQVVDANILYRLTASRLNITVDQVDGIIEWLKEN